MLSGLTKENRQCISKWKCTSNCDAHVTSSNTNVKENILEVGPERKKTVDFEIGLPPQFRKTK